MVVHSHFICSVHVVVATPGRILDLMKKRIADMSKCEMLVMDEVTEFCQAIKLFCPSS